MYDENEGVEILETTKLSPIPIAQVTSPDDGKKSKDKQEKKGVFRCEWLTEFNFLKEYKPDKSKATCIACNSQFSVHYGGKTDVVQHSKSKQHKTNMLTFSVDRQLITTTMKPTREKEEVAATEATLVYHGVKHRISYVAQQCTTNVLKILFASSPIAKSLSCAKTKASAIATDILAPYFTHVVLEEIKNAFYYSLSYDASNKGNLKAYPFCIQYFSNIGVKRVLIDFIDDSSETAIDVYRNARLILDKYELNFDGLTTIGSDNTNVNMGDHHSVFSLICNEKPNLIKGSCYNHILHNGVKHGHKLLTIDVEKNLLSIYSHFSRSAKRIAELKSYYEFYEEDYVVILKHIKIRWLTLHKSIERLLQVFAPVKDYFLSLDDGCPGELKEFFSCEEGHCVLSFFENILSIIQKSNLKLQRRYLAGVSLHRVITELKLKLQQRLDSSFFGASCRLKLSRLEPNIANKLNHSFARFIQRVIEYIDEYYLLKKKDKYGNIIEPKCITPSEIYEAISPFGLSTINEVTWDHVTKCTELFKIKNLNEDDLFNEFCEIQIVFKSIQDKNISIYDQIQSYIKTTSNSNKSTTTATTKLLNKEFEEEQDSNDDDELKESSAIKEIRSDQLWAMLLSIKLTPSPNLHKLICFLFSIPCSNAFVESVFSAMKHLYDDKRNRMSTKLVAAELKIRFNSFLSCTEVYNIFLSKPELLKLIHCNEKYCAKNNELINCKLYNF
ncbi:unnamed protein product [Rotaria magnacalcarata]|uniref:HAT C-terminal dimerisation domain-containing protein n=4 Tax=Rotaria magnacalcarata TaxID=392030 RepID=A0A815I1M6_9BILA|nr:unnamed protein product [Rotaria magnacalcarata]CAF3995303.1 unnamed protein product [Rotaria magnacalcarata]